MNSWHLTVYQYACWSAHGGRVLIERNAGHSGVDPNPISSFFWSQPDCGLLSPTASSETAHYLANCV